MADDAARKERARQRFLDERNAVLQKAQRRLEDEENGSGEDGEPQWSTEKPKRGIHHFQPKLSLLPITPPSQASRLFADPRTCAP